eukprot:COSAG01_NODE_9064_length_2564_cov_2.841849_2_plen_112_part_00
MLSGDSRLRDKVARVWVPPPTAQGTNLQFNNMGGMGSGVCLCFPRYVARIRHAGHCSLHIEVSTIFRRVTGALLLLQPRHKAPHIVAAGDPAVQVARAEKLLSGAFPSSTS